MEMIFELKSAVVKKHFQGSGNLCLLWNYLGCPEMHTWMRVNGQRSSPFSPLCGPKSHKFQGIQNALSYFHTF